jgi:hypothetical protein
MVSCKHSAATALDAEYKLEYYHLGLQLFAIIYIIFTTLIIIGANFLIFLKSCLPISGVASARNEYGCSSSCCYGK